MISSWLHRCDEPIRALHYFAQKFLLGATECFIYVCAYAKHMHSHGLTVIIFKQIDQFVKFISQAGDVVSKRKHNETSKFERLLNFDCSSPLTNQTTSF